MAVGIQDNERPGQGAYPAPTRTNRFAIASLVLAIVRIGGIINSVLAIVFGIIAKRQIDRSDGMQTGRAMATAGIVLGSVELVIVLLIVVLLLDLFVSLGPAD